MGLLSALAGLFGIEVEALLQRIRGNAIAYAAIALFVLICLVFLLIAAYTALTWWLGPIWAPLLIAAIALLIALIVFAVVRIQQNAARRRAEERRREAESTAMLATAALGALPELLQSSVVRNVGLPLALYAALLLLSGRRKDKSEG
jgi:hypothetical protein